jgi:hypothetical protein
MSQYINVLEHLILRPNVETTLVIIPLSHEEKREDLPSLLLHSLKRPIHTTDFLYLVVG